jgi:hypothetical protein
LVVLLYITFCLRLFQVWLKMHWLIIIFLNIFYFKMY